MSEPQQQPVPAPSHKTEGKGTVTLKWWQLLVAAIVVVALSVGVAVAVNTAIRNNTDEAASSKDYKKPEKAKPQQTEKPKTSSRGNLIKRIGDTASIYKSQADKTLLASWTVTNITLDAPCVPAYEGAETSPANGHFVVLDITVETTSDFVWQKIQPRPRDAHKGTFGSVLAVAGSASYRGAAALAVEGALRTGAGIVTLASVEPVLAAVAARLPECCLCPCEAGAEGGISPQNIDRIRRQKASVLLAGPGLGYTAQSAARAAETRALVKTLLPGFSGSAVLDADGLNAAADLLQTEKMLHPQGELILTPHPGEMARLTGRSAAEINADREGTALRYAKAWNAVVVLKGAHTVIAGPDGRCAVNPTGNPGLSRGGSGDVLAGMTSALLACGLPAFDAAACAVYLHGAAADRAAALHGETGMLPHDLLDALGTLFAENGR